MIKTPQIAPYLSYSITKQILNVLSSNTLKNNGRSRPASDAGRLTDLVQLLLVHLLIFSNSLHHYLRPPTCRCAFPEHTTDTECIWTSSDNSVATVDSNGLIKAVAAGTATIRATSSANEAVYDEYEVMVKAPSPVTDISLSQAPHRSTQLRRNVS